MSATGSRGRYAKGIQRRQEILEQALEVFAERGSEGTSLRAIADAIGIKHSTIKNYFSSLEELKLAVIEARDDRAAAGFAVGEDRTLSAQLHRTAEVNAGVPGLIALYTSLLASSVEPGNELARDRIGARFVSARQQISQSIKAGRAAGVTPPGPDADRLATLLLAAFDGLQVQWLLDPSIDLPEVIGILDDLVGQAPPMR